MLVGITSKRMYVLNGNKNSRAIILLGFTAFNSLIKQMGLKYDGQLYGEMAKHSSYHLVSSFAAAARHQISEAFLGIFSVIPFSPFPV